MKLQRLAWLVLRERRAEFALPKNSDFEPLFTEPAATSSALPEPSQSTHIAERTTSLNDMLHNTILYTLSSRFVCAKVNAAHVECCLKPAPHLQF